MRVRSPGEKAGERRESVMPMAMIMEEHTEGGRDVQSFIHRNNKLRKASSRKTRGNTNAVMNLLFNFLNIIAWGNCWTIYLHLTGTTTSL